MNLDSHRQSAHRAAMGKRADDKADARKRILKAAAHDLRANGVDGLKVADVMAAAGLTHGTFYAHFRNKEALIEAAFHEAFDHRDAWLGSAAKGSSTERQDRLLNSYLTPRHRDDPEKGCAFALLARDFAQHGNTLPHAFETELGISLERIEALISTGSETDRQQAIGLLSLCVGGMVLSRAVESKTLSNEILKAAAAFGAHEQPDTTHD